MDDAMNTDPVFDAKSFSRLPSVRLESERAELDHREGAWLRLRGWKYTHDTPGSYWMWTTERDGKTLLLSQSDAARFQDHDDREAYFDQHPEEMGDD